MPRFACPQCKTILSVEEEQRGTIVECSCGKRMKVPEAKAAAPSAAAAPASPARAGAARPPVAEDARRARPRPDDDDGRREERDRRRRRDETDEDDDASYDEEDTGTAKKRRKSNAVVGVLSGIGGLLVIAVFILIITGKWVDLVWEPLQRFLEQQGIHPILAVCVTGGILLIPIGLFAMNTAKSALLDNIPNELEFVPTSPATFENLDGRHLESYTEAFQAAGFTHLMDYSVQTDIEWSAKGFARLFVNPREHVFAEVNQVFMPGGAGAPMRCNILSHLEDGWSLQASNRTMAKESYTMRRPRALMQSRPDDKPAQLVAAHLQTRRALMRDLDLQVLKNDTADAYFEHARRANNERRRAVEKRWALGILIERWLFDSNPRTEWWGEYAGKRTVDDAA